MSNGLSSRVRTHDPSGDQLASTAVVRAVADVEGVGPLDLQPLGRTIDTDALDRLVDSMPDGSNDVAGAAGVVEFTYTDHLVRVTSGGAITIDPEAR